MSAVGNSVFYSIPVYFGLLRGYGVKIYFETVSLCLFYKIQFMLVREYRFERKTYARANKNVATVGNKQRNRIGI